MRISYHLNLRRGLILGAALLLGLAIACGREEPDAPAATTTSTPVAVPATAAAKAPAATAVAKADSTGADVAKLYASAVTANYSVTYRIEMSGQPGTTALNGTWKQVRDNSGKRSRYDMDFGGGAAAQITMITSATGSVMCTSSQCLTIPAGGAGFPDPSQSFSAQMGEVAKSAQTGNIKEIAGRTIAGVRATCFQFSAAAAGITDGTSCVSAEGVPLFGEWVSGTSKFKMEATTYANRVSDTDFTPPFPLAAMP